MPPVPVHAADVLTAGLRADYWDTYFRTYDGLKPVLSQFMELDIPSDKLTEIYGYFLSAPYPRRWVRGQGIPTKNFKAASFQVTNKDYAVKVPWHANDRQDDQTRSLTDAAKGAGRNFATLDERVLVQIISGSTDIDLLESIPNAPDGVAIFSATDGDGAARFGVSGGNIITGTGVASSEAIRTDYFSALVRMRAFQDTEGQPLWDQSLIDQGVSIMFSSANEKVFTEAFKQQFTVQSSVSPTNIILDANKRVTLCPTPRLSGNDWFVFLSAVPRKPIFRQTRQPIQEFFETMDNSDEARRTKLESAQWDCRYGYGVMLPYGCAKVDN